VKIDGGELLEATYSHTDDEGEWWYYEWDTTEVEDGWHDITAIVYDGIDDGHDVIEVYVENFVENSPPGIEIVEPAHGSNVSGTVTIWMVAWDPDGNDQITDVWVRIDGGELLEATYDHTDAEGQWWYYEWDTTEVANGWHDITAIAYDGIDDGHDIIEVYVENSDSESTAASITTNWWYLILSIMAMGAVVAAFAALGTEAGKFGLFYFLILPLYTKLSKKKVLDHFVRGEIYGYIKVHPGDNYTTIKRNLGLNNGSLTYHLSVLEREGLVKSWSNGGYKYFYPQGVKIPGNGVKNPSIYDAILKSIEESPGISVRDIAAVTGISRQLANYHIKKLISDGLIEVDRKSFSKVFYPNNGSS
jgi:predicted transcriptional regulator